MNVTLRDRRPIIRRRAIWASSIATCIRSSARRRISIRSCPQRWREHRRTIGGRSRQGLARTSHYPRMSPGNGMRVDAWPKDGSPPGSDLALMRRAAARPVRRRGTGCWHRWSAAPADERNVEFGAAMAMAVNEWQMRALVRPGAAAEGRGAWSPLEHEASALAEIERRAGDRRFAQVQHPAARAGAARAAPLLADPRSLRGERLPGLPASRRHQRPCLDRRRLAVLLP